MFTTELSSGLIKSESIFIAKWIHIAFVLLIFTLIPALQFRQFANIKQKTNFFFKWRSSTCAPRFALKYREELPAHIQAKEGRVAMCPRVAAQGGKTK